MPSEKNLLSNKQKESMVSQKSSLVIQETQKQSMKDTKEFKDSHPQPINSAN